MSLLDIMLDNEKYYCRVILELTFFLPSLGFQISQIFVLNCCVAVNKLKLFFNVVDYIYYYYNKKFNSNKCYTLNSILIHWRVRYSLLIIYIFAYRFIIHLLTITANGFQLMIMFFCCFMFYC